MSQFSQGHALLIGVGADLPVTIKDATGIADILQDPERCAYPQNQVTLLTETTATRQGILGALDDLANSADAESTVVFYFSGHGYEVDAGFGKQYFLMPYAYEVTNLVSTAIGGQEFMQKLAAIPAQKLLVLLDCCHAGGMDNEKAPGGPQFSKAPLPAEAEQILAQGGGRVIIASSQADEKSLTGDPYSEFTMALVEALAGYGVAEKDGYVRVADLAMYAREMVPKFTQNRQHPVLHFEQADNFAVAYYAGGDMEPKGLPKSVERKPKEEGAATDSSYVATNSGSGAVAQGPGAVAAGERGVAAGGNISDSTIVTGDGNLVDRSSSVFNQRDQTIHGSQTNIEGGVNTGGGAFNTGSIDTGGGDFVGRDKVIHGDEVRGDKIEGDKVGGDKISASVGDNNSNIAIGKNIHQSVSGGANATELAQAIGPLMAAVVQEAAVEDKAAAAHKVRQLQQEVKSGENADDSIVAGLVQDLAEMVPGAISAIVAAFGAPVLSAAAGATTKFVLGRLKRE